MRLIDANEIRKKAVPHTRGEHGYSANIRKWAVLVGDIDDAPTIEAEPVRHGRWERVDIAGEDPHECSYCGDRVSVWGYRYCPNCGAKMGAQEAEA